MSAELKNDFGPPGGQGRPPGATGAVRRARVPITRSSC